MTATSFAPGSATAYVSDDVIAVVADTTVDAELMRACAAPTSWDALLEGLAGRTDAAIVMRTDDDVRLAMVGAMTVEVDESERCRRIAGTVEWVTHRLPHARVVTVASGCDVDLAAATYCVDAGAVPASVVTRTLVAGGPPAVDAFHDLFGATVDRTVESAAVRDDDVALAGTRAPFGVLVFSTGERVIADRTIVLGRNPKRVDASTVRPGVADQRCVTVAGRGVSRRHAVIHVDRWHAAIDDLGSSNGTWVTAPGRTPLPVRAGHPAELVPGAIVDLGGEVSFAVEEVA